MAAKKTGKEKPMHHELYPSLMSGLAPQQEQCECEEEPKDQACYEFNDTLPKESNYHRCRSCRKYLTTVCDQIEKFLDDEGEVE